MANFILEFNDLILSLERAGGKGLSLAGLMRNGVPVPDGFVITTDAYKRYVEDNNILGQILAIYDRMDMDIVENQQLAAEEILPFFLEGILYEDIKFELVLGYRDLKAASVAVRSSATAEDLATASFAGLQDTFLNVNGEAEYLAAVIRTWASLWTQRAISYRARHGIHPQSVSMGVVVQEMVHARSAGVLFTMNPVNGERNEMLFSSGWGLGEPIVNGTMTPDTFVVNKNNRKILSQKIVDKRTQVVPARQGVRPEPVPVLDQKRPSISTEELETLTKWGLLIERMYGAPVDVEWVVRKETMIDPGDQRDHTIEIVQVRPITNMPSEAPSWHPPKPGLIMIRGSLAEQIPNPVTPLFGTLGLRMVNQPTAELGHRILGKDGDEYQYHAINGYVYLATSVRLFSIPGMIKSAFGPMLQVFRNSHSAFSAALEEFKQAAHMHEINLPSELTNQELLDCARNIAWASGKYFTTLQGSSIPNGIVSEKVFSLLYDLLKNKSDPPAQSLLYGLSTEVLRSEKRLYDLYLQAQSQPALAVYLRSTPTTDTAQAISSGRCPLTLVEKDAEAAWKKFAAGVEDYFDEFGYTSYDFDFSHPTPSEVPWITLDLLKSYLNGSARNPYEWEEQCAESRLRTFAEFNDGWMKLTYRWLEKAHEWAKRSSVDKEDSLSALFLGFPILRLHLAELGRRFVAAGIIDKPDDIYWLMEDEVVDLLEKMESGELLPGFGTIIEIRREEWVAKLRMSPPVMFPEIAWVSRMVPWIRNEKQNTGALLRGTASSGGTYTGTARVIFTSAEFGMLKPGEILVAVTTTPAWTPLFNLAGAIVTDIGGQLSHSSIIAREYGLPSVVATGNATRRILTGQTITVNGDKGEVLLG